MTYQEQFMTACTTGDLEKAKQLVQDYPTEIDIHAGKYRDHIFWVSYIHGHLDVAKWLYDFRSLAGQTPIRVKDRVEHICFVLVNNGFVNIKCIIHDSIDFLPNLEQKHYLELMDWLYETVEAEK